MCCAKHESFIISEPTFRNLIGNSFLRVLFAPCELTVKEGDPCHESLIRLNFIPEDFDV